MFKYIFYLVGVQDCDFMEDYVLFMLRSTLFDFEQDKYRIQVHSILVFEGLEELQSRMKHKIKFKILKSVLKHVHLLNVINRISSSFQNQFYRTSSYAPKV